MFFTTRSFTRRTLVATLVVVPFGMLACVKGDGSDNTTQTAEAATVPTVTPVNNPSPVSVGGTGVSTVPTYSTAEGAYKAGNYRDATEMYKVHVGAKPGDAHGFYMLGLSSWKAGDFKGAKDAFDKSIELNPKFSKSYFNQARVLLDMKRGSEALEMIEKGRLLDTTSLDGVRLKARAQSETGDLEGAEKTYKDLIGSNDADVWGLNNYGMMLMTRGVFDDAVGPLARAVQVQPTSPLFQNNLGMALERSGFKVVALKHYELAVKNDSSFTKAIKNVERLRPVIDDPKHVEEVDVGKLAEQFRQTVKSWKPKG